MKRMVKAIGAYLGGSKVRKALVRTLALVVVFATTYSLVLPAITKTVNNLTGELDGVSVRIEADGRAVPADTTMALKRVLLPDDPETDDSAALRRLTADEVELIRAAALDGDESLDAEILRVLDIALEYNGNEIEPSKAVCLVLQSELIRDAARPAIVHLDDNGTATLLAVQGEDGEIAIQLGEDAAQQEPDEDVQEPEESALPELPGEDESSEPAQDADSEESDLPAVDADEQESAEPEQNDSEETADEPEEALETPDMPEEQEDDSAETSEPAEDSDSEIAVETDGFSVYAIVDLSPKAEQPETPDETGEPAETIEFSDSVGGMDVYVNAPVTAFPEGTSMVVSLVDAEDVFDTVSETVGGEIGIVQAVDITFYNADGEEIEPSEPISVVIKPQTAIDTENSKLVHIGENETTVVENAEFERDQVSFDSGEFSTYVIIITLGDPGKQVYHGDGFTVTVTYGSDAGLPTGTIMTLKEIEEGSADYQEYFERTEKALNLDPSEVDPADVSVEDQLDLLLSGGYELKNARFYDIELRYNGKKIEPAAPVNVEIRYDDAAVADEDGTVKIVHFADDGTEIISDVEVDSGNGGAVVTYQQDSFSVTATTLAEKKGNAGWFNNGRMEIHYGRRYMVPNDPQDLSYLASVAPENAVPVFELAYINGKLPHEDGFPEGMSKDAIFKPGTTIEEIITALRDYRLSGNSTNEFLQYCTVVDFMMHETYVVDDTNWKHNGMRANVSEIWQGPVYGNKTIQVKITRNGGFEGPLVYVKTSTDHPLHTYNGVIIDNAAGQVMGTMSVFDSKESEASISQPVAVEIDDIGLLMMMGNSHITDSLYPKEKDFEDLKEGKTTLEKLIKSHPGYAVRKDDGTVEWPYYGTGVKLISSDKNIGTGGNLELFQESYIEKMAVGIEQVCGKTRLKDSPNPLGGRNTIGVALWPGQSIGKWIESIDKSAAVPVFLRDINSWKSGDVIMDSGYIAVNNQSVKVNVVKTDKAKLTFENEKFGQKTQTRMGLEYAEGEKENRFKEPYPVIRFYIGTVLNMRTGEWYSTLHDAVLGENPVLLQGEERPNVGGKGYIADGDTLVFFGDTIENLNIEIDHDLTIRSSFASEKFGNKYPDKRAGNACTATLNGTTITVAAGKTVTFGGREAANGWTDTYVDDNKVVQKNSCGGLTLDGNETSANIITNNGTLNLKDGITLTKAKAGGYAVNQNGEFHLYESAKFKNNGTKVTKDEKDVYLGDVYLAADGKYITLETANPNAGSAVYVTLGSDQTKGRDVVVEGGTISGTIKKEYLVRFPLTNLDEFNFEYIYTKENDKKLNSLGGNAGVRVLELRMKETIIVAVEKVDSESKAPLAGAEFTLTKDGKSYTLPGETNPHTTDEDGNTSMSLRDGTFTLTETNAPVGYDNSNRNIEFTVVKNDQSGELTLSNAENLGFKLTTDEYGQKTYTVTVTNQAKTVPVTLKKVDNLGNALEGVTFTLNGEMFTTDKDGKIYQGNFTYGQTYVLKETKTLDGYQLLSEEIELTVGVGEDDKLTLTGNAKISGDEKGFTVEVVNHPDKAKVQLYKIDFGTKSPLGDATFELRNEGGEVLYTGTSGSEGLLIENTEWQLEVDKSYTLKEISAPVGYRAMAGEATIRVDAYGVVVVDSPLSVEKNTDGVYVITVPNNPGAELPHTGGMGTTVYTFTGIALALGAVLLMIEVKRKGWERA